MEFFCSVERYQVGKLKKFVGKSQVVFEIIINTTYYRVIRPILVHSITLDLKNYAAPLCRQNYSLRHHNLQITSGLNWNSSKTITKLTASLAQSHGTPVGSHCSSAMQLNIRKIIMMCIAGKVEDVGNRLSSSNYTFSNKEIPKDFNSRRLSGDGMDDPTSSWMHIMKNTNQVELFSPIQHSQRRTSYQKLLTPF